MIPPDYKNQRQETTLTIDLLRHGAPLGGVKYRGALDDPLAPEGWEAMWAMVENQPPWDQIITSPLIRCSEFATKLGQRINRPVTIEPRLQEMNFGQWEGKTATEILATPGNHLAQFWQNPLDNPPPNGEHLQTVHTRVQAAWHEIITQSTNESILIVAHGGVIRILLSLVLLTPLEHLSRITVPYASLARIRVDQIETTRMPRLIFCGMTK